MCIRDRSTTSLSYFTFYAKKTSITNHGLSHLAQAVSTLSLLVYLDFDVSQNGNNFSDIGGSHITRVLPFLTCLTNLLLSFLECGLITDTTANTLSTSLRALTTLTHLHLYLGKTQIKSDGAISISNAISQLSLLQALTITLAENDGITNEVSYRIATAFSSLTSLNQITLNFKKASIDDNGVISIANGLRRLTALKNVELVFGENTKVSDDGCSSIPDALSSFQSLSHLNLSFWGYDVEIKI
eukprot:TRINITY_DN4162_c0_g1_i13.p1 TRINITY_DN4162_c0_g1~~TRINITY_DN4162_c0_g1_i13.p1  ORF type:complete len:243 (+),score=32.76 TRINITY_DN4162_c0_g1_i13:64-792(+)